MLNKTRLFDEVITFSNFFFRQRLATLKKTLKTYLEAVEMSYSNILEKKDVTKVT